MSTSYTNNNAELEDLITRIAWLYYQEKLTQHQIAEYLHISRPKVQRFLERAVDMEIIQFRIKHPFDNLLSLERSVINKYGIKDAVIVPTAYEDYVQLLKSLNKAAAAYLERIIEDGKDHTIGIGWGNSMAFLADYLLPKEVKQGIDIVSLIGNLKLNIAMNPHIVAQKIAEKLDAQFYNLWAPAIAQSVEHAALFKTDTLIQKVLDIGESADVIIIPIGVISLDSSLYTMGYVTNQDFERLKKKGAVGDILGRFINENGEIIEDEINSRVIGVDTNILHSEEKEVICISGGISKVEAIKAALKGGFIDILITNEQVAQQLV